MRRFTSIIILLFSISSYAEKAYLLPSRDGKLSEVIRIGNQRIDLRESVPIKDNTKGELQWLLNKNLGQVWCGYLGYDVDTFMVWFAPSASCSVLAYEVTNICDADPNQQYFTMFFATLDQGIDYTGFPEYHANGPPSSHRGFATVYQSLDTFAWGSDTQWTVTKDTLINPIDNGLDIFAAGWVKAIGDSSPQPYLYRGIPPYHTLLCRERGHGSGWYSSWYAIRVRALVYFYENPPPEISAEDLPDSYNQEPRKVNIYTTDFGVPFDSAGIENIIIQYQVNDGSLNEIPCILYSGDSTDGYWKGDIPGVNPMDTVDYWGIATDYQGSICTTYVCSYIIRAGNPGNFLFVDNGYTVSNIIQDYWLDYVDLWDYEAYGIPDSSVLTFYNTVVWRDWGCIALGEGEDYGAGIYYSDTTWIKLILDNGGNFWLSDQDQGYGFGICPDWGQHGVPDGHWVREYLGIKGMYDDNPQHSSGPITAFGDTMDPVIGDLFEGIGYQNPSKVYIAPYYYITGNWSYCYNGNFDSLQSGAIVNMSATAYNLIVSYRYTGPSGTYKVYNDFFPWDFIAKPTAPDTLDMVAIDSLVEDVLGWFGYSSGVSDETIEPEKVVKLLPIGIINGEAMIRFYLPKETTVNLSIYDNTGRLIKNLIDGELGAGLHTKRWNAKVTGVYFYRLSAEEKTLTNKMVVIK